MPTNTVMRNPAHASAIFREYLPENITVTSAASALHCSRVIRSRILKGHAGVTADMAVRMADYLGTSTEFWLPPLQYDLWRDLNTRPIVKPLAKPRSR
jgi:antitoxin HigA-1